MRVWEQESKLPVAKYEGRGDGVEGIGGDVLFLNNKWMTSLFGVSKIWFPIW